MTRHTRALTRAIKLISHQTLPSLSIQPMSLGWCRQELRRPHSRYLVAPHAHRRRPRQPNPERPHERTTRADMLDCERKERHRGCNAKNVNKFDCFPPMSYAREGELVRNFGQSFLALWSPHSFSASLTAAARDISWKSSGPPGQRRQKAKNYTPSSTATPPLEHPHHRATQPSQCHTRLHTHRNWRHSTC